MLRRAWWVGVLGRARWVGRPDGVLVRLRCRVLGHAWFPCDPGCCNQWWCERCLAPGPTLDGLRPWAHPSFARIYRPDGKPGDWMVFHKEDGADGWFLILWTGDGPRCSQCGAFTLPPC